MTPERSPLDPADGGAGGWVGVADSLLAGVVVVLVVALTAAAQLTREEGKVSTQAQTIADLGDQLRRGEDAVCTLHTDLAAARQQSDALREALTRTECQLSAAAADLKAARQEAEESARKLEAATAAATAAKKVLVDREGELAKARKQVDTLTARLDELAKEASAARAAEEKLKDELAKALLKLEAVQKRVNGYDSVLGETKLTPEEVKAALAKYREQPPAKSDEKGTIHAKLLGIQGKLNRVAILIDFSGSMVDPPPGVPPDTDQGVTRWDVIRELIATWCRHLDMDECVLIVFSSGVRVYGKDHPKADKPALAFGDPPTPLTREETTTLKRVKPFDLKNKNSGDRELLVRLVNELGTPTGGTNTLAALEAAYQLDGVTSILLFTDGMPGVESSEPEDEEHRKNLKLRKPLDFESSVKNIYALCDAQVKKTGHKERIPVNTIGVGFYFDRQLSDFLGTVAKKTGGTFIGR